MDYLRRHSGRLSSAFLPVARRLITTTSWWDTVDLLAAQEARMARARDLDLAQHLSNDDFDVLVVDLHALESIHVLDLAHEVVRQPLDAL